MDIVLQIRARAEIAGIDYDWIGFYEWLIWSSLRQRTVHLVLNDNVVNINAVFGPLVSPFLATCSDPAYVAGVQMVAGGHLQSSGCVNGRPVINHFVVAIPLSAGDRHTFETQEVLGSGTSWNGQSAFASARRAGFGLLCTVADGNCGTESMLFLEGTDSSPVALTNLRSELKAEMLRTAIDARWQEVFHVTQEYKKKKSETHSSPLLV